MRFLSWSLGTLALLALASFGLLQLEPVQDRLIDRVIRKNVDNSAAQALFKDDAMRLLVCGSGSPLPHPTRARPCLAVIAGGKFYIVDTGPGSWNQLALRHIPAERIGAILYTHFHSDHIGELGEFNMQTWVAGRPGPLAVYGPEGVQRLVAGYSEAYALDRGYRTAHHGAEMLPPERGEMQAHTLALPADGHRVPAFEDGELKVSVFAVHHEPIEPAVGYRFDYKGRSLVSAATPAATSASSPPPRAPMCWRTRHRRSIWWRACTRSPPKPVGRASPRSSATSPATTPARWKPPSWPMPPRCRCCCSTTSRRRRPTASPSRCSCAG